MSGCFLDWLGRLGIPGRLDHAATRQVDGPVGDGRGTLELVRGENDGAAGRPGPGKELVEKITAVLVESRMWLVEQPQPRTSRDEHGK
jgi:hypothetical protein